MRSHHHSNRFVSPCFTSLLGAPSRVLRCCCRTVQGNFNLPLFATDHPLRHLPPSGRYVTHPQVQAATEQSTKSRTPANQVHLYDREEKFYEICIYPRPRRNIDSSSYSLTWWPREDRDVGLGEVWFGTLIIFRKLCRKGVWVRMGQEERELFTAMLLSLLTVCI